MASSEDEDIDMGLADDTTLSSDDEHGCVGFLGLPSYVEKNPNVGIQVHGDIEVLMGELGLSREVSFDIQTQALREEEKRESCPRFCAE
ncbi:hypothetical protein PIB30_007741 [Stylosanthes scabra]|uniref:Uncharacterized protein n=1 Tax=Stylosanthes scabra TaxID=79078 RepID=A0ABU6Y3E2_9FABA|nr:hypothetical protein [Stylosanthes scabra]